jgi:hypothetical protein
MGPSLINFIPTTPTPTPKPTSKPQTPSPTHIPNPTTLPVKSAPLGIIEGLVYFDSNSNGEEYDQMNDFGVFNVPMWLFSCNVTHSYFVLNKTTTSTRGRYSFDGLIPGQYYVYVEPPAYYAFNPIWSGAKSLNGDLVSPEADSSFNPETGETVCLDLSGGEIIEQNVVLELRQSPTPAPNPPKTQPYFTIAPSKFPTSTKPTPQPHLFLPPSSTSTNSPTPRPNLFIPQPTTNTPTITLNPAWNLFLPTTSEPSPSPSSSSPTSDPTLHPAWNLFVPTTNKPSSGDTNTTNVATTMPSKQPTMPTKQPTSKPVSGPNIPNPVDKVSSTSSKVLKLHFVPVLASLTALSLLSR